MDKFYNMYFAFRVLYLYFTGIMFSVVVVCVPTITRQPFRHKRDKKKKKIPNPLQSRKPTNYTHIDIQIK